MTPLVVLDLSGAPRGAGEAGGARLDIFPGGATPSVFAASTPFWVAYGFAPDPGAAEGEALDETTTRFELEVDGKLAETRSELTYEGKALLRKTVTAEFPEGLPVGWHELSGRWYDGERLLLASKARIEFVER